jgi:hypothetical protein
MVKVEIPYGIKHATNLCQGIQPGQTYVFALISEKSQQISEPATVSHTVRPLSPMSISVHADFEKGQFKVLADLPPQTQSKSDRCQFTIISDQAQRIEQTVRVGEFAGENQ